MIIFYKVYISSFQRQLSRVLGKTRRGSIAGIGPCGLEKAKLGKVVTPLCMQDALKGVP